MANNYGGYGQPVHGMPPLQTHNSYQNQRPYSPGSFQQSPGAMSPTGGIPPAKRQRLSPDPRSPYGSPYSATPHANSPPAGQHLQLPLSPAPTYPPPSFHQPQPYQHLNGMNARPPVQNSMPPPPVPPAKPQDELEPKDTRAMDVNNISDVLTGSGIDLRAEEENLLMVTKTSFNSQTTATASPYGSFGQWPQGAGAHGAFQGTGPLSQPVTEDRQRSELVQKHANAARALAEASQAPLNDPFLFANKLRQRVATRAYEHGISVNLEGLFDKIPDTPRNITRTSIDGEGESITSLAADSLLNKNASFVEVLSLLSLAAEERIRTVLEDAFTLSQGRQATSDGVVPPNLVDIAIAGEDAKATMAAPTNISKTTWEAAPDSAISPMTVSASKNPHAGRLPTPPTDAPPTPQPTVQVSNHIIAGLKRKANDDYKFEQERLNKRKKRQNQAAGTPAEAEAPPLPVLPEKMTKKERDRLNKMGQTDDILHQKANETASIALGGIGGKKKYSWMTGGGGGGGGGGGRGSGASTPRLNTAVGTGSGAVTPAVQTVDRGLLERKRTFGEMQENGAAGQNIQVRDLINVLELDGKERKTLVTVLAKLRNTEKDEKPPAAQTVQAR